MTDKYQARDQAKVESKAEARTQDGHRTREPRSLDACYGRIGIPAVAAALTPRPDERRRPIESRFTPYDRD